MEWLKTEVRLAMHFYPSNNVPLYLHYMIIPYAKHAASASEEKRASQTPSMQISIIAV
jgi:hypothetical protein